MDKNINTFYRNVCISHMFLFCVFPFILAILIGLLMNFFGIEITIAGETFVECILYIIMLLWIMAEMHMYGIRIYKITFGFLKEIKIKDVLINVVFNEIFSITLIILLVFLFVKAFPSVIPHIAFASDLDMQDILKDHIDSKFYYLFNFILLVFLAPAAEEIIFRGIIFEHIKARSGIKKAIVISSLIFGILHLNINIAGAFTFGILSSLLYINTSKITSSIAAHSFNNFLVYIAENSIAIPYKQISIQNLLSSVHILVPCGIIIITIFTCFLIYMWNKSLNYI